MDILNKAKELAETAVDKAKDLGEVVADKAGDAVDAAKDLGEKVADKAGDVVENVKENDTVENITEKAGGFFEKAKNAVINTAENVTGKDLNHDGTIGTKGE